jgi:hypothetical protein
MKHMKPAYARMEPAHLFDGLFIPTNGLKRNKGRDGKLYRPQLHVPERRFGRLTVEFTGFEQLGAGEQSVLFAITAQLGVDGLIVENTGKNHVGQQLRSGFDFEGDKERTVGAKKTTLRSLLIDAGYKSETDTRRIKDCLTRLGRVQVREKDHTTGWNSSANLVSYRFNDVTEETWIAANPRLTNAIFRGQHVKISLFERNALNSEAAKILHAWMCSNIRPGKCLGNGNGIMLDTLLPHVWGPYATDASRQVVSKRRGQLRDSLNEIGDATKSLHKDGYGWVIDQTPSGLVMVSRPKELPWQEDLGFDTPSAMIEVMEELTTAEEGIPVKYWGRRK